MKRSHFANEDADQPMTTVSTVLTTLGTAGTFVRAK